MEGYFPDSFVNMLSLLGWNPGTEQEIFTMHELIEQFSIERVSKSGARFDPEKAKWFNHQYLQSRPDSVLAEEYSALLKDKNIELEMDKLVDLVIIVKERADFVKDMWNQSDFFFNAPKAYDEKVVKKRWNEGTPAMMEELISVLGGIENFSSENTELIVKDWIALKELNMGAVMTAFRLLIVGESRGPHLFDIIAWIGKNETLSRLIKGLSYLA